MRKIFILCFLLITTINILAEEYHLKSQVITCGDNTGYINGTIPDKDDPHFGWNLGEFFLTGFTRITHNEDGSYTLLKTIGNEITLYYKLQQNIQSLNGDKYLTINADKGYDRFFNIEKTNFGHGCLIIKHVDYRGHEKEPVKYFDFLKAKCSQNANTKVLLLEEGDYEIKLNYEIAKAHIGIPFTNKTIIPTYSNYYVYERIKIRNGECIVFPRDAQTGSELSNFAVTPNGFKLDLTQSHYLQLSVKREILQNNELVDTRMNSAVSEEQIYTDEGFYTITAYNPETQISTTKFICVGLNPILNKYAEKQGKTSIYEIIKQKTNGDGLQPVSPEIIDNKGKTNWKELFYNAGVKTRLIFEKIRIFFVNLFNLNKQASN